MNGKQSNGHKVNSTPLLGSNGAGPLREALNRAVAGSEYGMGELTVLAVQNDPYRVDTPAGHRDAAWFTSQIGRFVANSRIHLRGLHYQVASAADVELPNGRLYTNTDEDWTWLQAKAAKAARWLGYVPFDRIVDQRNSAPQIHVPEVVSPEPVWEPGEGVWVPHSAEDAMPRPVCRFPVNQPYRIIMIGEKASLDSVLLPVVKEVGGELLLPTGEISETLVADMAARVATDGRPAVVFYFSDFDPSGNQMAVSVSRKLQALRDLLYQDLAMELYPVALTLEQVREYGLPSTPLKESERRADRWREAMGHEQTEIDAMIALQPRALRQIARDAIAPFYDPSLEGRTKEASEAWHEEAEERMRSHPAYQEALLRLESALDALRGSARETATDAVAAFEAIQRGIAEELAATILVPPVVLPEPNYDVSCAPRPLFTCDEEYVTATRRLIDHKQLNGEERE
jgi:hypothetical protein